MTRIVTGLFGDRGGAERTAEHLVQELGIDAEAVEVHAEAMEVHAEAGEAAATRAAGERELLRPLGDLALPPEDEQVYREALRRGGILVAARVEEDRLDRVMDAFEERGAVDLDALEAEWRRAGRRLHRPRRGHRLRHLWPGRGDRPHPACPPRRCARRRAGAGGARSGAARGRPRPRAGAQLRAGGTRSALARELRGLT
jgi:hypothetical protein